MCDHFTALDDVCADYTLVTTKLRADHYSEEEFESYMLKLTAGVKHNDAPTHARTKEQIEMKLFVLLMGMKENWELLSPKEAIVIVGLFRRA